MRYLYNQGRFKLYEVEGDDREKPGTTGVRYVQDTILLFETAESQAAVGREVAWASTETDAIELAEDITQGDKVIPLDVQMSLASKIAEDKLATSKNSKAPSPISDSAAH